jgi:hypothetical protein
MNHLVIVKHQCRTKITMMNNTPCSYGILRTTTVRILHWVYSLLQIIHGSLRWTHGFKQICTDISAAAQCKDFLHLIAYQLECIITTVYAFRCTWEYLYSIIKLFILSPGQPGSIWKYLRALVRFTKVSGRLTCGFLTVFHFTDEMILIISAILLG